MESSDEALRLRCVLCGETPRRVLQRRGGPQDFHHNSRAGQGRRGSACRVIAIPDPYGDQHVQEEVPDDMTIEEYLEARTRRWRREFPFVRSG